jgi:integrase
MALSKRGQYWTYNFWFHGNHIQKATRLTNKGAALRAQNLHRERLARAANGIPDPEEFEDPPILADYIPTFLAWSKTVHRPATHALHRANCAALERYFGKMRLDDINRAAVEAFMVARAREAPVNVSVSRDSESGAVNRETRTLEGTVSPCTVNRAVTTLKLMYRKAAGAWPQLKNPASGVELLPEPEVQRIVTQEEFDRYLKVAPEDLRDVAILMRERGLRPQDAVELTCAQCDFEAQVVSLWPKPEPQKAAQRNEVRQRAIGGKTTNSSRAIVMSPAMAQVLKARVAEAQLAGTKYLFPMRDWRGNVIPGRPRNPKGLDKPHRLAIRKAGIEGQVRLYDLRHTFATEAIRRGVNLRVVQDMLGHSDPKITMRYTQRNDLVAQRAAFRALEG